MRTLWPGLFPYTIPKNNLQYPDEPLPMKNNYRPEKANSRVCNTITAKFVSNNFLLRCYICIKNCINNQIGRSQRHVPKGLSECLNINCCWPNGSLHQLLALWRHQQTKKRSVITLNQQMKKISQWTIPLVSCEVQYRRSNKKLNVRN
jgi:hypothetical protein